MSNTTVDNETLLKNLRDAVWGDQTIFKNQRDLSDAGMDHSHIVDYLDFGEYLTAIKVIAPTVRSARFLVREEYRLAFKAFEEDALYSGGACVMGQPGIGKSCFIAYAVIERLRNKQPVAVQIHDESYALFSEAGVSLHSSRDQEPLRTNQGIWAFSDSNADVDIPAFAFRNTPDVKVFQTTSPKIRRWKEWTKQSMITRYIMDVWSSEEITALAVLLGHDVHCMNDLALKWGAVPRTLLQILGDDQERLFEREMRGIALRAIPDCRNTLRSMANLDATLPVDSGPSSIFFIKPSRSRNSVSRVLHTIYVPTETIAGILGVAVCSAAEGDRQDFFNAMIASPSTRGAAGFIFQIWIHSFLSSGNPIQCSWHGKSSKSLPPTLRLASPGQSVCTNDEVRQASPPFYWKAPPDFEGIDGALFDEQDNIYAIQITVASKHASPLPGLDKLRRLLRDEDAKKKKWMVLFIGHRLEQSEIASRKYSDNLQLEVGGKKQKPKTVTVRVGWCATSPLEAEITAVKTLTNYVLPESDDE
ncbi:hypothetical protein L210DRAFT_2305345 [Boletus edulis BED1]|uniref:Uncharacterized protein n=1 Tax=Boletus edulis BED1 TaxID=1328754 RepID=A0AAD4GDK5_BOLED|nr:hypothetical protein L210DRAFT_2305345 [Boletus edulis BED1]